MKTTAESPSPTFPSILKEWRQSVGLSQLELALRCGSSQKHISFLESGRSNASKIMIFAISEALEIPLRDRNELLLAAGYAPGYQKRNLDDPALAPTKAAIQRILSNHEPFPAFVYDRLHNVLLANNSALKLQAFLYDAQSIADLPPFAGNILRGLLHPDGYKQYIENWDMLASVMLRRLRAESFAFGKPREAIDLLEELSSYPGIPEDWQHRSDLDWREPMLTVDFAKDDLKFSLFTTLTSLGAPFDITLQEIRIESYYPADDAAKEFFK